VEQAASAIATISDTVPTRLTAVGIVRFPYPARGVPARRAQSYGVSRLRFAPPRGRIVSVARRVALRPRVSWVVGIPTLLALGAIAPQLGWSETVSIPLLMIPPRLLLWAVLLRACFHPAGGTLGLLRWTLGGSALSTVTDVLILGLFDKVPALRFGWC
jgi:hypothetical protein